MARPIIQFVRRAAKAEKKSVTKKAKAKPKPTTYEVAIPAGVTITVEEGGLVKVKGSKGELSRKFSGAGMSVGKEDNKMIFLTPSKRKKDKAVVGAAHAHLKNMIHGVSEGVVYRMKIVYSHFPMNVKVQGDKLVIDNFLGEKYPRKAPILKNVNVEIKGQEVTLKGIDKELVSQTAANIEQITKIKGRDLRVFQDGIYITEKDGRKMV